MYTARMIEIDYKEIESKVKASGLPMIEILRRANIPYRTFYRWREGVNDARIGQLNDLLREVEKLPEKTP